MKTEMKDTVSEFYMPMISKANRYIKRL